MEEALQHIMNCFSGAAKNFGLTTNLKKIGVLYQPPAQEVYSPPHINIDGTNLSTVEHITYLGSIIAARILTTTFPKPAVSVEDCRREYGRVLHSAAPQRSRYTEPSSFQPSCTVQRPGFSTRSGSGYMRDFTSAAGAPSLA